MSGTVAALAAMICDVMGDDAPDPSAIRAETMFAKDLELESLEFVVFAEKVKERYGERVDFAAWLSGKTIDEILALRVGDLAEHIDRCLSSPPGD